MTTEESMPGYWTPILYDVAHAFESVEDPEARIDRVLELMRRFVPYDCCALLEARPVLGRRVTVVPAMCDQERDALAARLDHLLGLLSEQRLAGMRQITAQGAVDRAVGRWHLAVPIIELGETTGVILVESAASAYDEPHLAFLSVIAAQIAAYLAAVRSDRELRASQARFCGLYESGLISIAFMDASGAITSANQTFANLVGQSREALEAGAVNWHALTVPEDRRREQRAIRDALERGRCAPYEKHFMCNDGRRVTVLAGAARLDSGDSLVAFAIDISEQKRIQTERAELLEARESDLQFLEMFMGMLGHDLRTPLGAITMSADLLRVTRGARLEEATERILSSANRMQRMVEQLLDLTRIRLAGGMPLEPERVDLGAVASRVIDELKAAFPDASIELEVSGDVTGEWDSDRLLQVVSNLLGNAIQHARGSRQVTVRVTGREDTVELTSHNHGAIPDTLLPVLFDPFRGGEMKRVRKGLGLGLYITRHIVEAHGGRIEVDSSEAAGTTFTVRLPRRR